MKNIEIIKALRIYTLKQIEDLSEQQLNHIPTAHNNNIIWNLAHMISVHQNMCYVRSGLPITVTDRYFAPYLPGTKPSGSLSMHDIEGLKKVFVTSLDQFQSDLSRKVFVSYDPSIGIKKTYGIEINNIDDAVEYVTYHDGYHGGVINSLKRLVV